MVQGPLQYSKSPRNGRVMGCELFMLKIIWVCVYVSVCLLVCVWFDFKSYNQFIAWKDFIVEARRDNFVHREVEGHQFFNIPDLMLFWLSIDSDDFLKIPKLSHSRSIECEPSSPTLTYRV